MAPACFIGRAEELAWLTRLWNEATARDGSGRFSGGPRLAFILAETGVGKSRLVQAFYEQLVASRESPDECYWPANFGDGHSLRVNPVFDDHIPLGPPTFLWLGARWQPPDARNLEERVCVLPDLRRMLGAHVATALTYAPVWRRTRRAAARFLKNEGLAGAAEQVADIAGIAEYVLPYGGLLVKLAKAGSQVAVDRSTTGAELQRAYDDAGDTLLSELREVFGGFGGDGTVLPTVLWLDDAQWIDPLTRNLVYRLWEEATERRWPLLIIVTHWEREWYSLIETDRGDPDALHRYFDSAGVEGCILAPAPTTDLAAYLRAALPGLTPPQSEMMLEKASGNFLTLVENIGMLLAQTANFVQRRTDGPLSRAGEREVQRWESDRDRRIAQRFASLEPTLQDMLGWSSRAGQRFLPDVLLRFAADRIGLAEEAASDAIERGVQPYAILGIPSPILREFRDRAFHLVARRYFEDYQEEADGDALTATLRDTLTGWINHAVDGWQEWFARDNDERPVLLRLPAPDLRDVLAMALRELNPPGADAAGLRAFDPADSTRVARLRAAAIYVDAARLDRMWPLVARLAPLFRDVCWPNVPAWVLPEDLVVESAGAFAIAGVPDVAAALYAHEIALRDRGERDGDTAMADLLGPQADALILAGQFHAARAALERVMAMRPVDLARADPEDEIETYRTLLTLSRIEEETGHFDRSRALLEQAIALVERVCGADHAFLATPLHNLGVLHLRQRTPEAALPLLERARALKEMVPDAHDRTLHQTLSSLAVAYRELGRSGDASPLFGAAMAHATRHLGADHPDVATILNNTALLAIDGGTYDEAEHLLSRAVAITERSQGADSPALCMPLTNLADLCRLRGDCARGIPLARRALTIAETTYGPDGPAASQARAMLAALLHDIDTDSEPS